MTEQLKIARLDQGSVQKIRELEDEFGVQVMAFERGKELADLDADQIHRVRELEDELDVTLLVYRD